MKPGNPALGDPVEGREHRREGAGGGKDDGDTEPRNRLHETSPGSRAGREGSGDDLHDAGPSHRSGVPSRSLSADAQGRCGRVDGQTADEYAVNLEANLQSLLDRFQSGRYRAPAVRRAYVPKADGRERPIGIPTFEDKILQRAVLMLLEAVYEQDFLPCSFGFRPGRSSHQALKTLFEKTTRIAGGWLLEVDVQRFFEELDHSHLRRFLDQRVRDGVLRRAIDRWLKAGVLERGQ